MRKASQSLENVAMANIKLILISYMQLSLYLFASGQRTTFRTTTTERYPSSLLTGNDDKDLTSVEVGSASYHRSTLPTRRPPPSLPDLDYETISTHRTTPRTSTTASNWQDWELSSTSTTASDRWENWMSTSSTPSPRPNNRFNDKITVPSVNLTVLDGKLNSLNVTWNVSSNEALVDTKTVRQFTLTFSCNASYPIEWISSTSFGTNMWEIEEIRHFPNVEQSRSLWPVPWLPPNTKIAIYTTNLALTYNVKAETPSFVPRNLELFCVRSRRSQLESWTTYENPNQLLGQTMVTVANEYNATLYVRVQKGTLLNRARTPHQFHEELGSNKECHVVLKWIESSHGGWFECKTEEPYNVTIDYKEDNCIDVASCERRYTNSRSTGKCYNGEGAWRKSHLKDKTTSDLWSSSPPTAGVVYCKREGDFDNNTDALHFAYSLPVFCPEDMEHEHERRRLYVATSVDNGIPNDESTLRNGFMSVCRASSEEMEVQDWKVYAGENVTITCISSLYHFSRGTRFGLRYADGLEQHARMSKAKTDVNHAQGYINYTAEVHIKSADVTDVFCEAYLKQRESSVRKFYQIQVTNPTNISFIGEAQVTSWNYTGQRGFELSCEATGDPLPEIIWKKQGRQIPEILEIVPMMTDYGSVISVLSFPSLEYKDFSVASLQDTYTCEAFNKLDRGSRTFLVTSNTTSIPPGPVPMTADGGSSIWVLWLILPLFAIVVIAIIVFLVWKIKKQSQELRLLSKAEVDEFLFGKPEMLRHHASSEEVNNYAQYLPYQKCYEIEKEQLEIEENGVLGSGAYAIVLRGILSGKNGDKLRVAIKTARAMDDISFFKALLSELKIMGFIGSHPNIVNLVGAHTKNIQNREIFIAIEYCDNGNLLAYLRDHRNQFTNLVTQNGDYNFIPGSIEAISRESFVTPDKGLNTVTLIKWAYEISTGMEFLSQKKVIHGDLAARNILLNEYLVAKIGDFGLSRQLFEYANYIKKQQSPLPWKWLAIECLQDMRFSVKSDVWAYGIMLYEIFSLGQVPYPGHAYNDEFLEALVNGKRPNRPSHATNEIYSFMTTCWKDNSDERPSFVNVRDFFNKLLYRLVPPEYLDLHEKIISASPRPSATPTPDIQQTSKCNTLGSEKDEGKQARFSFNTKTITAVFHRN